MVEKFIVETMNNEKGQNDKDIPKRLVKYLFNARFFLFGLTRRSKILKKLFDRLFFEGNEIFILPNRNSLAKTNDTIDINIEINQSFKKDESEFVPSEIIKKVIKEAKDIVIMHECFCRSSSDCQKFPHDFGCIFLGSASKRISSKYARTATVEEALEHVDLADSMGLSHLIGRNKLDSLFLNAGPKEDLLTICHCCPCCCLWKFIPDLDDDISAKVMKLEGVEVHTVNDNCRNCKRCLDDDVCLGDAISLEDGKIVINQEKCLGCGYCVQVCDFDAIELTYNQKSVDSVLSRIGELVDYKK